MFVIDDNGWQQFDGRVARTTGLHDQVTLESSRGDVRRELRVTNVDAAQESIATDFERVVAVLFGNTDECRVNDVASLLGPLLEDRVSPVGLDHRGRGSEGEVVAAEGARELPGRPRVKLASNQVEGHRKAEAADGLGETDNVGIKAGAFKREERARAANARLHFVGNHEDASVAGQFTKCAKVRGIKRSSATFALGGLDDDGANALPIYFAAKSAGEKFEILIGDVFTYGSATKSFRWALVSRPAREAEIDAAR